MAFSVIKKKRKKKSYNFDYESQNIYKKSLQF